MKTSMIRVTLLLVLEASQGFAEMDTSNAASGVGVRVTALLHERVGFEAHAHMQLSHWCNATIPAQENRRNALHRLLLQTQVAQNTEGVSSEGLMKLQSDIAALDKELAEARLTAIATQSSKASEESQSHLILDDATKDVEALQHTLTHLGGASAPTNEAAKGAAALLAQAQETKHQLQKQAELLQGHFGTKANSSMSRMLAQYRNKKSEMLAYQQQLYTTQRSLDVLASALEDESEYLEDVRSVCSAEARVHQRLEKHVLPVVQSLPSKISASSNQPVEQSMTQATTKPAAKVPTLPVVPEAKKKAPPAAKPPAKKAAMLQHHAKAQAARARAEVAARSGIKKAIAVETQAKTEAKGRRQITKAHAKVVAPVHPKAAAKMKHVPASKPKLAKKTAPILQQTEKAHKSVHPPAAAKPKMKDPFADDSDDDAEDVPAAKPKLAKKPAPILQQTKKVSKPVHPPAAAKTKMKDPFADDDDDDAEDVPAAKPKLAKKPAPILQQTKKVSKPVHPAAAKTTMKDPFADDDDDDADDAVPAAKPKLAKKPAPVLQQKAVHSPAAAKPKMKDPFADDDDDDSDDVAPVAKSKPATRTAPILRQTAKADSGAVAGAKMKDPFADDDDADDDADSTSKSKLAVKTAPILRQTAKPQPVVKKSVVALQEAARERQSQSAQLGSDISARDDDSFESTADDKLDGGDSEDDATTSTKEGATVAAMKQELDVDEAIAEPSPDQATAQAQLSKVYASKAYESSPNALPQQYAAFTPSAKSSADLRKKALAEMGGDFDDDDDDAPKPVAHTRHNHAMHAPAPPPPAPPPPPRAPASDGVVYDDDDLPKHHVTVQRMEGGWEALIKKDAHATTGSPKLDPDVALMQSLYGKDGNLPSQYTAWAPDDAPKPAPALPQVAADSKDDADDSQGETMDLEATAKAFAKNPEAAFDFLQVASQSDDVLGDLIFRAAAEVPPVSFRGSTILLEASAAKVDSSRIAAASTVLAQYGEVLQSRPLKQLAKAKLSPQKLKALFQQLSNVDPLSAKSPVPAAGKQAQAEKMCNYLQAHMQAAAPVEKVVAQLQTADRELTTAVASQAAAQEEVAARTQLQKTVAQDVSVLTGLKGSLKHGGDSFPLKLMEKGFTTATAAAVGESFANIEGAHAELDDLLDAVLQRRTAVMKKQGQKLLQLQDVAKKIDAEVTKKSTTSAASQAEMEAISKKLTSLTTSCGMTLGALARRRHSGHMEAHAIEVALKLLGSE